ncbi:MAG: glycosyltransferase family 1 protein [Pseudomonadota bacterium]
MQAATLLDVSRLTARVGNGRLPTGVDRVVLSYIREWGPRAQAVLQKGSWRRIVPMRESQRLFELLLDPPRDVRTQMNLAIAKACLPPWPSQDAQGRFSFNLSHTGIDKPGLSEWLARTRQRGLFFVHDLIPITHPEYCRAGEHALHARRMETLLTAGAGLICNSQTTLDELTRFAQARSLPMPAAVVAPLAPAALQPAPDSTPPMDAPYFVVLGTIEPRKNHLLLLHVWRRLAESLGARAPHLVIVGQRGWECENVVDMLERCESLQGLVHELPHCGDAELARYLSHARALLFPSFAEGFGLPLLESLALGTPVVASSLPVFREIAGDIPDYLDNLDGPAWQRAVEEYARADSGRRAAQLERMAGLPIPTWDAHFRKVRELLERLDVSTR